MGRERSAFHRGPESCHSNEGRIHLRRPTLSLSFFACNSAADHTWKDGRALGNNRVAHFKSVELLGQVTIVEVSGPIRQPIPMRPLSGIPM
jgi:hypothetical protein